MTATVAGKVATVAAARSRSPGLGAHGLPPLKLRTMTTMTHRQRLVPASELSILEFLPANHGRRELCGGRSARIEATGAQTGRLPLQT